MNVRSIFRPWVVSVDGDDRLAEAADRMHNEQVGSVVVMVGGRFAGILTERDLTRAMAERTLLACTARLRASSNGSPPSPCPRKDRWRTNRASGIGQ